MTPCQPLSWLSGGFGPGGGHPGLSPAPCLLDMGLFMPNGRSGSAPSPGKWSGVVSQILGQPCPQLTHLSWQHGPHTGGDGDG